MIKLIMDKETELDFFYALRHDNKVTLMQILQADGYKVKITVE